MTMNMNNIDAEAKTNVETSVPGPQTGKEPGLTKIQLVCCQEMKVESISKEGHLTLLGFLIWSLIVSAYLYISYKFEGINQSISNNHLIPVW